MASFYLQTKRARLNHKKSGSKAASPHFEGFLFARTYLLLINYLSPITAVDLTEH